MIDLTTLLRVGCFGLVLFSVYLLIALPIAMAIGRRFREIQKYYPEVSE